MPGNANIEAALDNLWDVVNEEGYELVQIAYDDPDLSDEGVEIARVFPNRIGPSVQDIRICAVPAQAKERHYDVDN